jgi:hypothetical protein
MLCAIIYVYDIVSSTTEGRVFYGTTEIGVDQLKWYRRGGYLCSLEFLFVLSLDTDVTGGCIVVFRVLHHCRQELFHH